MTIIAVFTAPAHTLRKTFQYLFLIFGCLHLIGGPSALVQTYAWANMIISYSQEGSVSKAVVDTFSGKKPCRLCKQIAAEKKSESQENREPLTVTAGKNVHDLFPPATITLHDPFSTPFPCPSFSIASDPTSLPTSGPPVPPPRC